MDLPLRLILRRPAVFAVLVPMRLVLVSLYIAVGASLVWLLAHMLVLGRRPAILLAPLRPNTSGLAVTAATLLMKIALLTQGHTLSSLARRQDAPIALLL